MSGTRFVVLTFGISLTLAFAICPGNAVAAEFSDEVIALPFPPDARQLTIVDWTGEISYKSSSPLASLGAFYLKEMVDRGWEYDESAVKISDKSIRITFRHDKCRVKLSLNRKSNEVIANLECDDLKYTDTNDPAKLVAAGIPVPPVPILLQKEFSLAALAQDIDYVPDGCTVVSSMKVDAAFDHCLKLISGKGYRESGKRLIKDSFSHAEFQKDSSELSVNVFPHEVGSRIVLEYEGPLESAFVPPLPPVDSRSIGKPVPDDGSGIPKKAAKTPAERPINVIANKGSATVACEGKNYTFGNVASYQEKGSPGYTTILFSSQPIPYDKIQAEVSKKLDFSFSDLYEFEFPNYFTITLGSSHSFSLSVPGIGIGRSIEKATNEMEIEAGRVRGTIKMLPDEDDDWQVSFTATVDAAVITPTSQIAKAGAPTESSNRRSEPNRLMQSDLPVPMPAGAEAISQKGSKFRKTYGAVVAMPLKDVNAFYFGELIGDGWTPTDSLGPGVNMRFEKESMELFLALKSQDNATVIEIVTRDVDAAKQQGLLPEPGKGRLVLANAHNVGVVFTIGKSDYPVAAGRGAQDLKQALNYSVGPGTYRIVVKIPGQEPQTESIKITEDSAWAVVVLPTGGYLPTRLY